MWHTFVNNINNNNDGFVFVKVHYSMPRFNVVWSDTGWMNQSLLSARTAGFPATETRLIQYRFPEKSGRLCPRWVPSKLTASPLFKTRTPLSHTTSLSLNEGHPWLTDSLIKSSKDLPLGATNSSFPVLLSWNWISPVCSYSSFASSINSVDFQ